MVAVTAGLWALGGGAADLLAGGTPSLLSLGRLTGLLAALAALAGLYLAARPRHLERTIGLDRMLSLHRITGIATLVLVLIHATSDIVAWVLVAGVDPFAGVVGLLSGRWMVSALVAALLMTALGATSWRRIRSRLPYETWYFLHLTGYLAVLLAFGHQVVSGTDTATGPGRWWWIGLFAAAAATIAWSRSSDLVRSLHRGRATIVASRALTADVTELTLRGGPRDVTPGQFFGLRLLHASTWWQVHPYSVCAVDHGSLRFAVKRLGDGSSALADAPAGSRVILEGPYGVFTAAAAQGRPVLLIAGGIGVAPISAVLQQCRPEQRPVVIVRTRDPQSTPYLQQLRDTADALGGRCEVLAGPRSALPGALLRPQWLASAVPDIAERDVFLCGPTSLEETVVRSLRQLGLSGRQIHRERFGC